MLNLRDLIYSQSNESEYELGQQLSTEEFTTILTATRQRHDLPIDYDELQDNLDYGDADSHGLAEPKSSVLTALPYKNYRRPLKTREELPALYVSSPQMRSDISSSKYMPGLTNYLYFHQPRGNRKEVRREIVRTLWDDCVAANDLCGALMALEVLVEIGEVFLSDIEKFITLLRYCDKYSPKEETTDNIRNGQLSSTSVAVIKRLCEIMITKAGLPAREEIGGLRSSGFILCCEALLVEGHINDAWQLFKSYASAPWFMTSKPLHLMCASVAVIRSVSIAHEWFHSLPSSEITNGNLQIFLNSKIEDKRAWFLPTMEEISTNGLLFEHIVRLLSSKRVWARSHAGRTVTVANTRNTVLNDLKTALDKAVKKDKSGEYLQLHEYTCAYLTITKSKKKALEYIKSVLQEAYNASLPSSQQINEEKIKFCSDMNKASLWRLSTLVLLKYRCCRNNLLKLVSNCDTVSDIQAICENHALDQSHSDYQQIIQIMTCIQYYVQLTNEASMETFAMAVLLFGFGSVDKQFIVNKCLQLLDITPQLHCYIDTMPPRPHMMPREGKRGNRSKEAKSTDSENRSNSKNYPQLNSSVNNRIAWRLWTTLATLLGNVSCTQVPTDAALDDANELNNILYDQPTYLRTDRQPTVDESCDNQFELSDSIFKDRMWWRNDVFAEHLLGNCVPCITQIEVERIFADPIFLAISESGDQESSSISSDSSSSGLHNQSTDDLYQVLLKRGMNFMNSKSLNLDDDDEDFIENILSDEHDDSSDEEALSSSDEDDLDQDINEDADKQPNKDNKKAKKVKKLTKKSTSRRKPIFIKSESAQNSSYNERNLQIHTFCRCLYFLGATKHSSPLSPPQQRTNWLNEWLCGQLAIVSNPTNKRAKKRKVDEQQQDQSIHDEQPQPQPQPQLQSKQAEQQRLHASEVSTVKASVVSKRVFDLFEKANWERTSWQSHEKFTRLKIDIAQYLHYKLDKWDLEALCAKIIVCSHFMQAFRKFQARNEHVVTVGQDCLFVARGLQVIVMHALIEIDDFNRASDKSIYLINSDFCALRCIARLTKNNVNVHRGINIALRAACVAVDVNTPLLRPTIITSETSSLRHSVHTTIYKPKY